MARALREQVANLKFQIDLEMRIIMKEDEALTQTKKIAKAAVERAKQEDVKQDAQ